MCRWQVANFLFRVSAMKASSSGIEDIASTAAPAKAGRCSGLVNWVFGDVSAVFKERGYAKRTKIFLKWQVRGRGPAHCHGALCHE
jgi:hypothetical protein